VPKGEKQGKLHEDWSGARGLAEDVRRYGAWMREEAEKRIGHLYPKVEVTAEMARERPGPEAVGGAEADGHCVVVGAHGKESKSGVQPCRGAVGEYLCAVEQSGERGLCGAGVEGDGYRFTVKIGALRRKERKNGTKLLEGRVRSFLCLAVPDTPIRIGKYIKAEGTTPDAWAHADGNCGRGREGTCLSAANELNMEAIAQKLKPTWKPDVPCRKTRGGSCRNSMG
jgi:putative DNA methylase